MEIILNDKNGVILRTAKKHCKEDIQVNIDAKQIIINPSEEQQIQEGLFGEIIVPAVTAEIDENIKPEHIIEGIEILGVNGGFKGVDSSNATATAKDMLRNKTAYINNKEVQGEIETYNGDYSGEATVGNEWETLFAGSVDETYGSGVTKIPNGIKKIRTHAFYKCLSLALKELPESVTEIGAQAFYDCNKIAFKKLPNNLTTIEESAFYGCTSLALTNLPDGITELPKYAFYRCISLDLTELPSNLKKLGNQCFYFCKNLTSLTFKADSISLDSGVFNQCQNLERLIFPNITSVPTLAKTDILNYTKIKEEDGYIYVPDNLVESFKTDEKWSAFADKIKPISELEV